MKTDFNINHSGKEKKNSFAIPENYFEELPSKILSNCKDEPFKNETKYLLNKSVLAYAASILIIFGISISVLYFTNENENSSSNNFTGSYSENLSNIADLYEIDEKCLIDFLVENNSEQNVSQHNNNAVLDYIANNTNNDNEIIELIDY